MVKRGILILVVLALASVASAVGLRDLIARISAGVWSPGPKGSFASLDYNEYFRDSSQTLLNGATSVTFAAWVRCSTASPQYYGVLMFRDAVGIRGLYTSGSFSLPANRWVVAVPGQAIYSSTNVFKANEWTLLVATWALGQTPSLYVGTNMFEGTSRTNTFSQGDYIYSGWDDFEVDRSLRGAVDDFAIYKDAPVFTSADVAEAYNNGNGKPFHLLSRGTNGLVRHAKMDGAGSQANYTDDVSSTVWTGTGIGSGDWFTNGIVPQY